jgi:hypothetical protein
VASPGLLGGSGVSPSHDAPYPLRRDKFRPPVPSARRSGALRLRSVHGFKSESSVDMAPPRLRELIALSLLAALGLALRWLAATCFSSLFLAPLAQWRLSEGCNVFREPIGSAVAFRVLPAWSTP